MVSFYEFFAGAGMARAGLGKDWTCLFANEYDVKKAPSIAKTGKSGTSSRPPTSPP